MPWSHVTSSARQRLIVSLAGLFLASACAATPSPAAPTTPTATAVAPASGGSPTPSIASPSPPSPFRIAARIDLGRDDSDERLSTFTVTRIDVATARITARIPVGRSPQAIAVGEGSVWAASHDDGTLSRIDPATGRVTTTVRLVDRPDDMTGSAHGLVAGAGYASAMMIHEQVVLPVEVRENGLRTPISLAVGFAPLDAAVVDGIVWVGASVYGENEDRRVGLIDAATLGPIGVGDVGARCCFGMVAAAGSVWVATRGPNQLLRLELTGS